MLIHFPDGIHRGTASNIQYLYVCYLIRWNEGQLIIASAAVSAACDDDVFTVEMNDLERRNHVLLFHEQTRPYFNIRGLAAFQIL